MGYKINWRTSSQGTMRLITSLGILKKSSGVSFLQVHLEDLLEMLPEASFCHSLIKHGTECQNLCECILL